MIMTSSVQFSLEAAAQRAVGPNIDVPRAHRAEVAHELKEGPVLCARHEVVDARVRARVVARRGREHGGHRHTLLLEEGLQLALYERRVLQVDLVPSKLLHVRQESSWMIPQQLCGAVVCGSGVWRRCVAAVGCCEANELASATVAAAVRDRRRLTGCSPSLGSLNSAECCEAKSEMESVKPGRLQKSSIFSSRPRGAWVEAACVY